MPRLDTLQHYPVVTAELVRVQRELMDLDQASADPRTERQAQARRTTLLRRRDALLDTFGRLGLSWMLEGGSVELVPPPQAAPDNGEDGPEQASSPLPPAAISAILRPAPARASSWPPPPPPRPLDRAKLSAVLSGLGPPPTEIDSEAAVREELGRLGDGTSTEALAIWEELPKEVQRALVATTAARARHVQDEISPVHHPITVDQDLDRLFSALTAFSRVQQPGFVYGLRRQHHPVGDSWGEDARRWWGELSGHLAEEG